MDTLTIQFFRKIYPILASLKDINTPQMAEITGYSEQAAVLHRNRLTKKGYLIRNHYRSWKLNPNALVLPLLTVLLSLETKVYTKDGQYFAVKGDSPNVQLQ